MAIEDDMADLVDRWRKEGKDASGHTYHGFGEESVAWWFDDANATTPEFMEAMRDSRYVEVGDPDKSAVVVKYLDPTRDMGAAVGEADTQIIRDWIAADCPIPAAARRG